MTKTINSKQNQKWKIWSSLTASKGINEHKLYLVSGKKIISEFYQDHPNDIVSHLTEKSQNEESFELTREMLKILSPNEQVEDILVVKQPHIKPWTVDNPLPQNAILVPLGDPLNLGAVLRSAYAFDVQNIILLKEAANPFLPKAVKTASGVCHKLNFYKGPSIQDLASIAPKLIALDMNGEDIATADLNHPVIVGEEGPGLPNFSWKKIKIAMNPNLESLNANVALAILLHQKYTLK